MIAILLQTPTDQQSSVLLTSQDLAAELGRRGHQVTIVTPDDFPSSRRVAGRLTPLVYPFVVRRWMRQHAVDCDLVVFQSYSGWLAVSTAAAHAVPTVIAFHGLEPLYHQALREEAKQSGGLSWRYRLLQERVMPFMLRTHHPHAARAIDCPRGRSAACQSRVARAHRRGRRRRGAALPRSRRRHGPGRSPDARRAHARFVTAPFACSRSRVDTTGHL